MNEQVDKGYKHTHQGKLHKSNGPAWYWANGYKTWWLNDKVHRYYGPAEDDGLWWIHDKWIKK